MMLPQLNPQKQFIDGKDVELWQNNRKVVTFGRKSE
jgi:hypothetical protein